MKINVNGYDVYIDEDDLKLFNRYNWYVVDHKHTQYLFSNIRNSSHKVTTIRLHRLLLNVPKGLVVDHINMNGLDNRKENLRVCKQLHNCWNTEFKYTPVYRDDIKKYASTITINKKSIHLGYTISEDEAIERYEQAFNIRIRYIDGILTREEANNQLHNLKEKYQKNTPKFVEHFEDWDYNYVPDKQLKKEYIDFGIDKSKYKITQEDKEFIKASSMKQVDLAKKFNISPQYVNGIKKGRR